MVLIDRLETHTGRRERFAGNDRMGVKGRLVK